MSDFTDYLEQAIRDWMSQGTAFPAAPDPLTVELHTADPGESPDGTTEVSAGDYSAQTVAASTGWDSTTNPTGFDNTNEINFGQATSNWGTISHVAITDGTNYLASFALDSSVTINTDDTFVFNAGDLSFEIQ